MRTYEALDKLCETRDTVTGLEQSLEIAREERDKLIILARKTGARPTDIADAAGINRQMVYKILDKAGLKP